MSLNWKSSITECAIFKLNLLNIHFTERTSEKEPQP